MPGGAEKPGATGGWCGTPQRTRAARSKFSMPKWASAFPWAASAPRRSSPTWRYFWPPTPAPTSPEPPSMSTAASARWCERAGLGSFAERERRGDGLERLALGGDTPACGDQGGGNHQGRREQVAGKHAGPGARVDENAEQPRRHNAADPGADGVEKGDGERPDFQRKCLGRGEIGGARRGGGEEEN